MSPYLGCLRDIPQFAQPPGPQEGEPHRSLKSGVLGAHLSTAGLQSWSAWCEVGTLYPSGETPGFEFPPHGGLPP